KVDNIKNAWGKVYKSSTWQGWLEHAEVMVEQLRSLVEFQVGDRVKWGNMVGTIKKVKGKETWTRWNGQHYECHAYTLSNEFIKIGGSMCGKIDDNVSRYDEIKQEIEDHRNLKTGWNKRFDDILQGMGRIVFDTYVLYIPFQNAGMIRILARGAPSKGVRDFQYSSQCKKNDALHDAAIWFLDHSDIKDQKAEKREELQRQLDDVKKQQDSIQEQIDKL
ncbi:hypothetical protein LCGC14_2911790, partial [marine sediment metagenome]